MATVHHQTYFKCAAVLQGQKKIISNSHVQSERDTGQVNLSQLRAIETEHVIEEKKKHTRLEVTLRETYVSK